MSNVFLRKNNKMDYIQTDDNELVIFNPESGDTHFLNEMATVVFNLFDRHHDVEDLVEALSKEYDAEPAVIEADVRQTIIEFLEKGILIEVPR